MAEVASNAPGRVWGRVGRSHGPRRWLLPGRRRPSGASGGRAVGHGGASGSKLPHRLPVEAHLARRLGPKGGLAMCRPRVAMFLALALMPGLVAAALPAQTPDSELERGIDQVREGDFGEAVITLDDLARRLAEQGDRSALLARTYVYLSIAYLGLSRVETAKATFIEALAVDSDIELTPEEFPPRFMEFFEETTKEMEGSSAPTMSDTPTLEGSPETTGSSKTLLAILGAGAGAAGAALALAGGGDGASTADSPDTSPPQPSATVTSPQAGLLNNCRANLDITVTVHNPTGTELAVMGVTWRSESVSGGCEEGETTLSPRVLSVAPGSTAIVLDQQMCPASGCGCCWEECSGWVCWYRHTFIVLTDAGDLVTDSYEYGLEFSDCAPCASSSGTSCRRR